MIIKGIATVYNEADEYNSALLPASLDKHLNKALPLCFEHRQHLIIGETVLTARANYIRHETTVFNTAAGQYVKKLIEADVLDSVSLGYWFNARIYSHHTSEGFYQRQNIGDVLQLDELSIVCMPGIKSAVFDGKLSKAHETLEATVNRLRNFLGIGWVGKEADEINEIIYTKYRQFREQVFNYSLY